MPLDDLADVQFTVPSMMCDGCAERARETLSKIPGVRSIKTKLWRKRIQVQYEPSKIVPSQLKAALDEAGFIAVEP
jgi:copper chaperone CopZ